MQAPDQSILAVDIGTTSAKAVLFGLNGSIIARHSIEYPLQSPEPLAAEQDPELIYNAVLVSIRNAVRAGGVDATRILCVAFSAAMHSLIAVDHDGRPLTQCITWADNRSAPWAQRIRHELNGHAIYQRTGTPIHAMSPLSKLAWLRETRPALFAQAARFISIKEYVFHRLFGRYVVDHSMACATGLFNLEQLAWDEEALQIAGIDAGRLSAPVATTAVLRGLDPQAALATGLDRQTAFVIGASDGVLANLGANAIDAGAVAVTIGTSGAVRSVVDRPLTDPEGRTFCYALTEHHWVVGGPVNNGGIVLRWIRDLFAGDAARCDIDSGSDSYDALTRLAGSVEAGSEGLIFNPYLTGERAPLWNSSARGSFFGLAMHHRKPHMVRAALEGVVYNLYSVLQTLESVTGTAAKIHATGGFSRSALWRQIVADVFNRDVYAPESPEGSCLGAAVLGLYALGHIETLGAVAGMVRMTARHRPIPANVATYARLFPIFSTLPGKLQHEYEAIARLQR